MGEYKRISVNGLELNCYCGGEGRPVVLVHGNGESHQSFSVLIGQLEEAGYSVIAPDSRGHGGSDPADEYHYADMAEDIFQLINVLGLEKPALYGFSDGGIIGLTLELAHPGTLSLLAVSGTNLSPGGLTDEFMASIDGIDDPLCELMRSEPDIDPEALAGIQIPVLVTAGEFDVVRPEETELILSKLPYAEDYFAEGEDHGSYIENNPFIGELLLEFFREHNY